MLEGACLLGLLCGVALGVAWERARAALYKPPLFPELPPASARQVRRDRQHRIADISVAMARPELDAAAERRIEVRRLHGIHDFDHEGTR